MVAADGDALLAAVLHAPADDAPRLVYADWLDENGDAERAAFVRCQIELARLKAPDVKDQIARFPDDPMAAINAQADELMEFVRKRDALRARERQLFDGRWFPQFPGPSSQVRLDSQQPARHAVEMIVRRGFVEAVRCTVGAFVGCPCPRCAALDRAVVSHLAGAVANPHRDCPACSGTGRTPGLAAALAAAVPLTGVALSGTEPQQYDGGWYWFLWAHRPDQSPVPNDGMHNEALPGQIFELLDREGDPTPNHASVARYSSAEAANLALSTAAVTLARTRAVAGGLVPADLWAERADARTLPAPNGLAAAAKAGLHSPS